jgi:hypothetical protein
MKISSLAAYENDFLLSVAELHLKDLFDLF